MTIALVFITVISLTILFCLYFQHSQAKLYENGTCTDESLTNISKIVINTSGTVEDFLKSLPSDNTILAEMVCNDNSNRTNAQ
jgi:hypothetical protein